MNHREICKLVSQWLLDRPGIDLVSYEMRWQRGVVDAIGVTSKERVTTRKILIAEVKRTRSDLLQDLRKQKMLKYQKRASHCYLAATAEALRADQLTTSQILTDLKSKGLPVNWGVLLVTPSGKIQTLRGARKLQSVHGRTCNALTRKIARSYMYRVMSPTSPVQELYSSG